MNKTILHGSIAALAVVIIGLLNTFGHWNSALVIFMTTLFTLGLAIVFHNTAAILSIENWSQQKRWIVTGGSYLAIIFGLVTFTWYLKMLTLHSGIPLTLYGFYSVKSAALTGLSSIALLLVALYLFSHRLMLNIAMIGLSKYTRLIALIITLTIASPIISAVDLQFQLLPILLVIFIYISLFDLYIDHQLLGITWFIIWMVWLAICAAGLLYHYNKPTDYPMYMVMSYFSCTFLMLIVVVLLLFMLSRIFKNFDSPMIGKATLRNRIQILVVLLTLASFAIVGAATISFFQNNVPNWQQSIYEFIDWLIKIYAFLLLATGVLAIVIANSITRPIVRVGEKLSNLQLGKNEPIDWQSQDEIGELISEYNRMIAKLENSTEKLKVSERESAWREMAKQVAHEIKNPLTPMKLSIQYLQHAAKSNPQDAQAMMQRVASTLIEQIDGLARIATEFSNFAKMPKPENQTFVLNEVIQSVFDLFAQHSENDIALNLQLPPEKLTVFTDKDHIIRVLNNLIKNAQQAIPNDRHGNIQISLYANDGQAIVQVQDNGSGIPLDMRQRVFHPNFTTKSSGTGLGLAMSKNIVEAAGGAIWLESEENVGTSFYVALPTVNIATPFEK